MDISIEIGLTQQASVRRGPRASATSLFTVSLPESEASAFLPNRVCGSPKKAKRSIPAGEVLRRKAQRKVSTRAFLLHAICIPNLALSRVECPVNSKIYYSSLSVVWNNSGYRKVV